MAIIDTHAHLYLPEFEDDRKAVMDRARKAGVSQILLPAIDASTHQMMLEMELEFPQECFSMMGLHPCSVKRDYLEELRKVEQYMTSRRFLAVGEIGLDFHWDKTFVEQQYAAFHRQVELALEYGIPISIHSREATSECIQVILEHQKGSLRGVFHCFSGDLDQANRAVGAGFYLGIGGVLTFKNSGLDKVIADVDLKNLVLETDAPYLAPVPYRGKRNESSYLSYIVQKLAEIKSVTREEVIEITSNNARDLFGL